MNGNYDETVTTLGSQMNVRCANCGPELTTLGVFANLTDCTYADITVFVSCTNCTHLTHMAIFPNWTVCNNGQGVYTSKVSATCNNCTALTKLLDAPVFLPNQPGYNLPTWATACTDCAAVQTVATLPLASVSAGIQASCTRCASVVTVGAVPYATGSYTTIACTDCPLVTALGTMDYSTIPNPTLTCINCPALVQLGVYPNVTIATGATIVCINCTSLTTVATVGTDDSALISQAGNFDVTCTNCPAVTTIGRAPASSYAGLVAVCTDCPLLTTLGDYPASTYAQVDLTCVRCASLSTLGFYPGVTGNSGQVSIFRLACTDCPALVTLGSIPQGVTGNYYYMDLVCTRCSSVTTIGNLPMLIASIAQASPPDQLYIALRCTDCPALTLLGNLSSFYQPDNVLAVHLPTNVYITCTNCPALTSVTPLPSLSDGQLTVTVVYQYTNCPGIAAVPASAYSSLTSDTPQRRAIFIRCTGCSPTVSVAVPVSIQFINSLPTNFSVVDGASVAATNVSTSVPPGFLAGLSAVRRLTALAFTSVTALPTLDRLAQLERVDGLLAIQGCTGLTNMDGVTVSLESAGAVHITNNPALCGINTARLAVVTDTTPVISGNAAACATLYPVAPAALNAVAVTATAVQLNWTVVAQPSVAVVYVLTLNGVGILTYRAFEIPPLPFTISPLSPGTAYTFALSATLDGIGRLSPFLTVATPSGTASVCPPGSAGATSDTCVVCGAGTFAAQDGSACVPCPAGTASSATGLASSAGCEICGAQTYAPDEGQTTCTPCPAGLQCPYGATAPFAEAPAARAAASSNSNQNFSVATEALPLLYIVIIVFASACVLVGLIALVFRKQLLSFLVIFAGILKSPRWLLIVDKTTNRLVEPPSLGRGVIGVWAVFAVIAVTVFQCLNFAYYRYGTASTLQPGTTFSSGASISTAPTTLSLNLQLVASPVNCSSAYYAFNATLGGIALATPTCQQSLSGVSTYSTILTVGTAPDSPLPLSSSSSCILALTITAAQGGVAFAPVVTYTASGVDWDGATASTTETIVGTNTTVVTGTTAVAIAGVTAENLDINGNTLGTGYTFSYLSTTAGLAATPSSVLELQIQINVPAYYLQVRQFERISVLLFLSGLLALGSGVLAGATLAGVGYSFFTDHPAVRRSNSDSTLSATGSKSTTVNDPDYNELQRRYTSAGSASQD